MSYKSENESTQQEGESQHDSSAKNRKQIIVWMIAMLLVVVIAIISLGYNYWLERSPKALYLLAEYKSLQSTIKSFQKNFGSTIELQQILLNQPSSSQTKYSGEIHIEGRLGNRKEIQMASEFLRKINVTKASGVDPLAGKKQSTYRLQVHNRELASAEVFQSAEHIALKIPMLNDHFFYLENEEWGPWIRGFYPNYVGPERIWTTANYKNNFGSPEENMNKLKKVYVPFIVSQLKEEQFTLTKGVSYSTGVGDKKLRKLELKLSAEEVESILRELAALVSTDEELPSKVREAAHALGGIRFPDGLTMTVLIDGSEHIVERRVSFAVVPKEVEADLLTLDYFSKNWTTQENRSASQWLLKVTSLASKKEASQLKVELESETKPHKQGNTYNLTGKVQIFNTGGKVIGIEGDVTINRKDSKGIVYSDTSFVVDMGGRAVPDYVKHINGSWKRELDQNLKNNYSRSDSELELYFEGIDSLERPYKLGFNLTMDNEVQFTEQISFPELKEREWVNIGDLSPSDWQEIRIDAEKKIQALLLRNIHLFIGF